MRTYSWPGNVRQLKNCLERAVILSNNGRITVNELPPEVVRPPVPAGVFMAPASQPGAPIDGGPVANSFTAAPQSSPTSLRDVERQQILSALEQTGWHRGKTAEITGISPSNLDRRLRDYNSKLATDKYFSTDCGKRGSDRRIGIVTKLLFSSDPVLSAGIRG